MIFHRSQTNSVPFADGWILRAQTIDERMVFTMKPQKNEQKIKTWNIQMKCLNRRKTTKQKKKLWVSSSVTYCFSLPKKRMKLPLKQMKLTHRMQITLFYLFVRWEKRMSCSPWGCVSDFSKKKKKNEEFSLFACSVNSPTMNSSLSSMLSFFFSSIRRKQKHLKRKIRNPFTALSESPPWKWKASGRRWQQKLWTTSFVLFNTEKWIRWISSLKRRYAHTNFILISFICNKMIRLNEWNQI